MFRSSSDDPSGAGRGEDDQVKDVLRGFLFGLVIIVFVYLIVFVALPDKTKVCEYEWNGQGQKIAERCWNEWGERD